MAERADPAVQNASEERKVTKTVRRLALLAIPCGSLLLALHGTASASQVYYPVPELDPSTAASALVLLGGGVLMLVDRLRSR
jgi:hypothetical protein